jgi:molecular chaperone GrpE
MRIIVGPNGTNRVFSDAIMGDEENIDPTSAPSAESDQLAAAVADRDANYERWVRAQAEFENYRKRAQREADEARKYFAAALVRDVLGPLDNLHRAVAAAEAAAKSGAKIDSAKAIDELLRGVQMVTKQFDDALAKHNVVPIEAVGQPFDPNLHEALTQVPSAEHPPGTVIQEAERGYRMHDRVIRPSRVIVSAPKESTERNP